MLYMHTSIPIIPVDIAVYKSYSLLRVTIILQSIRSFTSYKSYSLQILQSITSYELQILQFTNFTVYYELQILQFTNLTVYYELQILQCTNLTVSYIIGSRYLHYLPISLGSR
jgi:hypothetical protein